MRVDQVVGAHERGFHHASADLNSARRIVVYNRREAFPLNADTEAVGLHEMVRRLGGGEGSPESLIVTWRGR